MISNSKPNPQEPGLPAEQLAIPEFTTQFVLRACQRWWPFALPLGLLIGAAATWLMLQRFQPVYEATTLLQIKSDAPYLVFSKGRGGRSFADNQVELLQSELVLNEVLARPEVVEAGTFEGANDPVHGLARRTNVSVVGKSDLISVTYSGSSPGEAALVANAICEAYFAVTGNTETEHSERVIKLLTAERAERQAAVEQLREEVRTLSPTPVDPALLLATAAREPLGGIDQRLTSSIVEQAILQARITAYEEWTKQNEVRVPALALEEALDAHPEVQAIKTQIAANRVALEDYRQVTSDTNLTPYYGQLERRTQEAEGRLLELREELTPRMIEQLKKVEVNRRVDELARMKDELQSFRITQSVLEQQFASDEEATAGSPEAADTVAADHDEVALELKMGRVDAGQRCAQPDRCPHPRDSHREPRPRARRTPASSSPSDRSVADSPLQADGAGSDGEPVRAVRGGGGLGMASPAGQRRRTT